MIHNVVGRHLPTKLRPFSEHEVLVEAGTPNVHAWPFDHAFAGSTESACRGWSERVRIEPQVMRMRPGVGVLQYVGADGDFRRVTGRISDPYRVRTGPERGQKHSGLGGVDAANLPSADQQVPQTGDIRSEEHTSELQSPDHLVCRLL